MSNVTCLLRLARVSFPLRGGGGDGGGGGGGRYLIRSSIRLRVIGRDLNLFGALDYN